MNRPACRLLLPALIAAALLAGCGDDEEETTVTETVSSTAAETEATETRQTTIEPDAQGNHGPKYFSSPSGNIGCYVAATGARCDIRERDWEPPPGDPVEAQCELDYGQGIGLSDTHASFVCAGDTALGATKILAYGETSQRGSFVCESTEAEMVCSNTENGAGFALSRQGYRIF